MRRYFISVGLRAMIAPLLTLATAAMADEPPRQLGAHEHGHGYLDIALDGDKVVIELQAPGSEVVVSKAAPGSDERKRDADAAV